MMLVHLSFLEAAAMMASAATRCCTSSSEPAMASIISTTPGVAKHWFPTSRGPRRRAVIADVTRTLLSISRSLSLPLT
uniref:Putative secreted protein n=1 Tax=Ixodes ricinus TaxID=34613 RepID=A0A6B0U670_IXORI